MDKRRGFLDAQRLALADMPAGRFGMIADGRCPWRMAATVLWGSRDAARCHLAFPVHILLRHTANAPGGSYIHLETERVHAS